jgi:inosose dehydratase
MVTRRQVLTAIASGAVSAAFGAQARKDEQAHMRFGYAAITWGDQITQAIDDISAVGYRGIQLRSEAFQQFGDRPAALTELLDRRRLTFVALSSGNLSIDPAREQSELDTHVSHAKFLHDAGGLFLQIIDERPKGRTIVADDYRRLGRLLTTLGRRVSDVGVRMVYHPHMNSLGERPEEVAAVLAAADRQHVGVLFDIAHSQQGGGNPAADIRKYREWIQVLHLKDVRPLQPAGANPSSGNYQFVELGLGRVNVPGVFSALKEIGFSGWGVVELDRVPDPGRTPKESAEMNKRYLVDEVHQTI